jgi:nitrate reductase gamma subunit
MDDAFFQFITSDILTMILSLCTIIAGLYMAYLHPKRSRKAYDSGETLGVSKEVHEKLLKSVVKSGKFLVVLGAVLFAVIVLK